jgi:hypothetical protein
MTTKEHADLIDLVIARAPKLRDAGVLVIRTETLHVELAPATPEPAELEEPAGDDLESNPWNDPTSFGRTKGVPGKDPRRKE